MAVQKLIFVSETKPAARAIDGGKGLIELCSVGSDFIFAVFDFGYLPAGKRP